ncbi:transcriptional regulator, propionate catabolism operon regulatory protein [Thermanaeromonas toyohensis ToBE]|uniref:Transcriptional regulator, propionate catabolism operon regulatory protein n=1 Tax=Thermanaeromonas toyohensis ToBE TaxID=698762 RepID=A0A1W1VJN2_9FIRM|nr:sigma 54-interacting transcriptional regulator [Thermanaeromonas toyohensis]SMB93440.1 transcriptional regulator, propionate catabolism operon regulatory protein [Thermanaeromonas toyohensis ToBE]
MSVRIVVVSWGKLTEIVQEVKDLVKGEAKIEILEGLFDQRATLELARELESSGKVDVFVSGGGNARMLRANLSTPVVSINISGYDMIKAILKHHVEGEPVYIVHFGDVIQELNDLKEVLPFPVYQIALNDPSEGVQFFRQLQQQGQRAIIVGASLAWEMANQYGFKSVYIYSKKAVLEALNQAVEMANVKRREMAKTERIQAILDFICDGIVACDQEGIITAFNPAAQLITGIEVEEALGKRVQDVLPQLKLEEVLQQESQPTFNNVVKVKERQIMVNKVPVNVKGETVGVVATLHDIATIQKAEYQIRRKLASGGLKARATFEDIVGDSEVMLNTIRQAQKYATTSATVLILGETGTGKELFAQAIHNASPRRDSHFVAINCAALPENLLESELFGYEEGAFTGAKKAGKPGLFELAHNGTIFLDEIGDLPPSLQAKLLRVLQQKEVMRIGGQTVIPIDVRVIAATNCDLWKAVQEGRFRRDLYYRLNVLPLRLPPLRERVEDIPALVRDMLFKNHRWLVHYAGTIAREIIEKLPGYSWPGNVRELENILERISALAAGQSLSVKMIKELVHQALADQKYLDFSSKIEVETILEPSTLQKHQRSIERNIIYKVLNETGGNKTKAAKLLGISRSTLWRKLKELSH